MNLNSNLITNIYYKLVDLSSHRGIAKSLTCKYIPFLIEMYNVHLSFVLELNFTASSNMKLICEAFIFLKKSFVFLMQYDN